MTDQPIGDIERFMEESRRTLLEARMLPEGPLTAAIRGDVIEAVNKYLAKYGISQTRAAREMGRFKANTLSQVLSGTYNVSDAKLDDIVRALNNWMEIDAQRRKVGGDCQFVETTVAKRIMNAARTCVADRSIGLVHGRAGSGKSMTAGALLLAIPGAILIRIGEHQRTSVALRSALRAALRLDAGRSRRSAEHKPVHERIYDVLRDSGRLLIVDEAHQIAASGLNYIRDLYDECNIPVLLLCTKDLLDVIRRDADPDHGQLYSRLGFTLDLANPKGGPPGHGDKMFTIDDIVRCFENDQIKLSPGGTGYLLALANYAGHGSLRSCRLLMKWAMRALGACGELDSGRRALVTEILLAKVERDHKPDWSMRHDMEQRGERSRGQARAATG